MLGLNPLRLLMVAEQFADIRWIGEAFPTDGGWEVQSAHRLSDVARLVAEGVVLDALLIFSTQANESLSDSCERLASQFPRMAIVLITEEESDSFALSAIRLGVQDCFTRMESERIDLPRTIRFAVERQRRQAEVQNEKARDLSERLKELGGFHAAAMILRQDVRSLSDLLEHFAGMLPATLQHPSLAMARVAVGETAGETSGFERTGRMLECRAETSDGQTISVEVGYRGMSTIC